MYRISLNRIHDRVRITEGNDRLDLKVDSDPMRVIAGLNEAQRRLKTISDTMPDEDRNAIATYFAAVIFGENQAKELMDFYHDDAACVINVCGKYFSDRLAGLITKAQKRIK